MYTNPDYYWGQQHLITLNTQHNNYNYNINARLIVRLQIAPNMHDKHLWPLVTVLPDCLHSVAAKFKAKEGHRK